MKNTGNGSGVCQQSCNLAHLAVIVNGAEIPSIQECIPIRKVNQLLLHLCTRVLELGKEAAAPEVVVIFIGFLQSFAN